MPPKRKASSGAAENTKPKAKKQKIVDKESTVVDSGFHNINYDITKNILDNLKCSMRDLQALAQSCSSWFNRIGQYYREKVVHITPYSIENYTRGQKVKNMKEVSKARQFVSDIQAFDINTVLRLRWNTFGAIAIPWCSNIVVAKYYGGFCVIDLRQPDGPLFNVEHPPEKTTLDHLTPFMAINPHKKQLLLTVKPYWKVYSNNHWDRKKLDQSTAVSLKLRIYNITIDGKVDLAQEIDTKWFESPSAGFMRADGAIWMAGENKVQIFLQKMDQKFDYEFLENVEHYDESGFEIEENVRNIIGIIEHNNTVKFVLKDLTEQYLKITLYDTVTKNHQTLPLYCHFDDSPTVLYTPDSLQFADDEKLMGLCTLDPPIKPLFKIPYHLHKNELRKFVTASPDGTRLLHWKIDGDNLRVFFKQKSANLQNDENDEILYETIAEADIHFEEEKIEPDPIEKKKKRKKQKRITMAKYQNRKPADFHITDHSLGFFWLNNELIIAMHEKRLAILDFRRAIPEEGFKSFEMPLLEGKTELFSPSAMARITDTSFLVFVHRKHDLRVLKITV